MKNISKRRLIVSNILLVIMVFLSLCFKIIIIDGFGYHMYSYGFIKYFKEMHKGNGIMTPRYLEDKISIAQSVLDFAESFRIDRRHDEGDSIPPEKTDMIGEWFEAGSSNVSSYARRFRQGTYEISYSPLEMSNQIKPQVDTIFYSPDSLLCVALVIIETKYAKIKGYKDARDGFDGMKLSGWRENKDQRFRIYPNGQSGFLGFPKYEDVSLALKLSYFIEIIGNTNTRYFGAEPYKYGVNDPRFFETAPEFKKNDKGEYNMMYFWDEKYYLYTDTPEYVNRKVTEEEKDRLRAPLKKLTVGY